MPRLMNKTPDLVHPKLPNALVQQLDAVADTFDIIRARVARVIVRESLADASLRAPILAEIERQSAGRLRGESTIVSATMDPETALAFADLLATTGARGTEVARSIFTVACDGRLSRFKKAFIAEGDRREGVLERQRAKVFETAKRLGIDMQVIA